jgi:aspartyl protease family protein
LSQIRYIAIAVLGIGAVLLLIGAYSGGGFLGLDGDIAARTLYFGVLASVMATWVVGSRARFGETVRTLSTWVLIVLVLIAGYQYRYELQDVASRVTAGLVPGSPLSGTDAEGRATVILEKQPNGHFGARAGVDGTPVDMIVDTGATSTVLTQADARRAGFDLGGLSYTVPVATANGVARAAFGTAREITVGNIIRRNVPVLVAAEGSLEQSLLGMNFMSTLTGFDVRGDRMILRD